jgi:hypothetical protein
MYHSSTIGLAIRRVLLSSLFSRRQVWSPNAKLGPQDIQFETQKPTQCVCWGSEDHPRAVLSDCAALTNDNRNKRNALAHGGRIRQDIITISEEKNLNVAARWEAAFLVHYNISYAICANIQHRIRIQT